jgi:hypothetical protein
MDGDRSATVERERMKTCSVQNSIILILTMIAALPAIAASQADTIAKAAKGSAMMNGSPEDIHSLYTGLGAGSNMIYLGSSISNNKPFYAASVTYGYRNSLFASASASHISETTPYLAFYNLALNYSHAFNSWFDISSVIAGYKSAESLHDSLFEDFAYINLTAGFDWKLLYTKISFSGIVSEENGLYLQIRNSRYFETPSFFSDKAFVSFDPFIDILFGSLISIETVNGSKKYGKAPPFSHGNHKPGTSSEKYSEKFGLMDIEFSLPVTFSYGKFSFEAEASYLLPVYSDPFYPDLKGFTVYLNAFIKIF